MKIRFVEEFMPLSGNSFYSIEKKTLFGWSYVHGSGDSELVNVRAKWERAKAHGVAPIKTVVATEML